jgi:hypothetical protein
MGLHGLLRGWLAVLLLPIPYNLVLYVVCSSNIVTTVTQNPFACDTPHTRPVCDSLLQ